ncbi:DNA polymerase domain-containing protein [Effusibacillus consociatus]|uniref:DNA polymerase domain-containing protein n=1 Tax=Effusibacillus consociatus TaxID=1117041 RepID=A0ABV9Q4N2_9BACL
MDESITVDGREICINDRLLMIWIYPHGINDKKIEKRLVPESAPDWITQTFYKGKQRILLNDRATLAWVGSYPGQEIHVPFDRHTQDGYPTELVFDLDPPDSDHFELTLEVALKLKEVLDSLGFVSVPKTSGATGLQIYVPIQPEYTFKQTRHINKFIADYMLQQMPEKITLERVVEKRGKKLYFDYLQLWAGRTMVAPYSVRARTNATVSAPVMWEELQRGFDPTDFTIINMPDRIRKKGDLFSLVTTEKLTQSLDEILGFLQRRGCII